MPASKTRATGLEFPACAKPDRRKCLRRRVSAIGPVENLPVTKLATAFQAEAARSHATQGKRDHGQFRNRGTRADMSGAPFAWPLR